MDIEELTRDLRQRYEGTYVRVEFPGEPATVFHVDRVVRGPSYPALHLSNDDIGAIILNYDTSAELLFEPPPIGYFWFQEKVAVHFSRYCGRQWRRGVAKGNSTLKSPYQSWYVLPDIGHNTAVLSAAYAAKRCQFHVAVDLLQSKKCLSVPLTPTLALGQHVKDSNALLLWFDDCPIGEYFATKNVFRLHEKHFEQEVVDFFKREDLNVSII